MLLKDQENKKVYSDGTETELRMLKIAEEYPEDLSQDYIGSSSEYTLNNTFSAVRQNILNWYPFKEQAQILEVGAGMGSITGMLCDKASHVTAIEMSDARAGVIRARYPERENLTIISEDINVWKTEERFDYVIFIGVLEYAEVFSKESDPFRHFLASARNLLKEDGVLLFAIENKFGLKYWVGGSEDHLQKPYVGIEGYIEPKTPKTFSKQELKEMLVDVGLQNHRFYYVLPDYKFPELIFTDEFKPNYMNLQKVNFTYSKNSIVAVDEKKIYKDVIKNDVFDFFANSYLIEASKKELADQHIIHISAKGEVKKEYRVSTLLDNKEHAYKMAMHKEAGQHLKNTFENGENLKKRGIRVIDASLEDNVLRSEIHQGASAQEYFVSLLQENDLKGIYALIDLLEKNIRKSSEISKNTTNMITRNITEEGDWGIVLEYGFVDMTFYNAFYEEGELLFYDQEWCFNDVPLLFILYYAVKSAYFRSDVKTNITFENILSYLNIGKEREVFDKLEEYIWSKILYRQTDFYGDGGYCNRYSEELTLEKQFVPVQKYDEAVKNYSEMMEQKRQEAEAKEAAYQKELDCREEAKRIQKELLDTTEHELSNKEGHIQLLLESERKLNNEIQWMRDSRTWKLASKIRRGLSLLAPEQSRRRRMIGKVIRILRGKNKASKPKSLKQYEKIEFTKCENPRVSIIIPVYNQFDYTYHCLVSILKRTEGISYEVIVANDCSTDLTRKLKEVVKGITVIDNKVNLRFLKNCNNAAKCAKGEYILFLNNDTEVQENWLEPMLKIMDADSGIGMTGSKLIYGDGTLQEAGGIFWKDASAWNYGNKKDADAPEYNYLREADYISGACILIRKTLWEEIGGFDEQFEPAYYEDADLAFMVRQKGYKVVYQPLSVVKHFEGISNGTDLTAGQKKYQTLNQTKFMAKWQQVLEKENFENGKEVFLAKDRSRDKKQILVVDHYVPHHDKDAGGKCTYMYLKLFVEMGYKVTFIGDNFFKHEPYTTELNQMGIEVLYGNYYFNNWKAWLKENAHYFDYIYLQRPHISEKYIDLLKLYSKAKIIYFGHDLHFLREKRQYEITGDLERLAVSEEWKKREFALFEKADVVHVVGTYEQELLQKEFPGKAVRNIPLYIYDGPRENISRRFDERRDLLFVGGFGHPPNTDAVLWFAEEIFPQILTKYPDIKWYIVGSKPPKEVEALASQNIIVTGFLTDEALDKLYNECRLVVVPLRYGAGVKGKVIEAAYYQIPIVTTQIGAEGIPQEEKAMIICQNEEEFAESVTGIYEDWTALGKISEAEAKLIKEEYSWEKAREVIEMDMK